MAPTRRETTTRSEKLDLRLTPEAKRALQLAAAASQRSVSEFELESALQRAADAWAAFQEALDAPPRAKPRLKKLLAGKSRFERTPKK